MLGSINAPTDRVGDYLTITLAPILKIGSLSKNRLEAYSTARWIFQGRAQAL